MDHIVSSSILSVRKAPSAQAVVLGRLPKNTRVQVLEGPDPHGWSRIRTQLVDGELTGWVAHHRLTRVASPVAPLVQEPVWLRIARGEIGVQEYPGAQHNPRIVEYHSKTGLRASDDETPWCSSFANWCMAQARQTGTGDARARSWLTWPNGTTLTAPKLGCITVFRRGTHPAQGHVAFFLAHRGAFIDVLGGNQSNQVKVSSYAAADLLGWRWPANVPLS